MSPAVISIIIFVLCIISFVVDRIPLAVTCLVGGLVLALLKIISFADVYSTMGSSTIAILLGTLAVGMGMEEAGVSEMVGSMLDRAGVAKSERFFLAVVALVTAILSAFLSNSAVIAMFIPIIQGMSKKSGGIVKQKNALMVAGMGAAIGGACTLAGTATIVSASGIVAASGVQGVRSFFFYETGFVALPVALALVVYIATFGYKIQNRVLADLPDNPLDKDITAVDAKSKTSVPAWKKTAAICIALFMIIGFAAGLYDVGTVSLMSGAMILVTGVLPWKKYLRDMDWNTILVLTFASALAKALNKSGGGAMIAQGIVGLFGGVNANPFVLLFVSVAVGALLTNFMGNVALVIAMIPISLEIATACGANPMCFALATTVACNLAFATPIGTACMTQTLIGGYRFNDYVKIGLPYNIIAVILVALISPIAYGL